MTRGRLGYAVDPEIVVLKIVSERGAPLAGLWNFAIHGTMLGKRNLLLSSDVMGVASRQLESTLGVPVLFVNGAVGDVSPRFHGLTARERVGGELAAAVQAQGCSGGKMEFDEDDRQFEVDDAVCNDGRKYDLKFDPAFKLIRRNLD